MLSRFSNEVLSHGSSAVLPQNLSDYWIKALQKLCDDFLDSNFTIDQCTETLDMGDPVLVSCVHEVLHSRHGAGSELSAEEMAEKVTIYALSITMETIRRESGIKLPAPTLKICSPLTELSSSGKSTLISGSSSNGPVSLPKTKHPPEKAGYSDSRIRSFPASPKADRTGFSLLHHGSGITVFHSF